MDTLPLAAAAARAVQPSLVRRELVTLYAAAERVRHEASRDEPANRSEASRLVAAEGTQAMRGITRTGQPSEVDEGAKTPFMAPASTSVWTARQRNVDSLYPVVGRMPHSGELILEQVPDAARAREVRIDPLGKPPELQSSFWRDFPSPSLPTQSSGSAKTASKKTIVAVSTLKSLMSRS